jgi:Domain of unknown function (DUF4157)
MTIDFHEDRIEDARKHIAARDAEAAGGFSARRWLNRAQRIVRRRLPGQSARRFADLLSGRRRPFCHRLADARQAEERLQATRFETPGVLPDEWTRASRETSHSRMQLLPSLGCRSAPLPAHAVTREETHGKGGDPPSGSMPTGITHGLSLPLDAQVQKFLSGLLDFRIPAVKIHTNQAADQVARRFGADAVAWGDRLLFRSGRYEPATARGLALLGHELTHAAQAANPPKAPGPETAAQEELLALANEQRILDHLTIHPLRLAAQRQPAGGMPGESPALRSLPAAPPAVHAAAIDRPLDGDIGRPPPPDLFSERQLRQIKDAFKMWCKEDHERGA